MLLIVSRSQLRLLLLLCLIGPVRGYTLGYDCIVEPHEVVNVGSPVMGILDDIPVERGDSVRKGQLLAALESGVEEISIKLARARRDYLKNQHGRMQTLQRQSLLSDESFEQVQTDYTMAEMELRKQQYILQRKKIASPVNGVVVDRLLSVGEYVYEQAPIMIVAQLDPLSVEALLPIELYGKIEPGMKAQITLEQPIGGEYEVTAQIIDKVIDAASATFGVRFKLPNPQLQIPAGPKCSVSFAQ